VYRCVVIQVAECAINADHLHLFVRSVIITVVIVTINADIVKTVITFYLRMKKKINVWIGHPVSTATNVFCKVATHHAVARSASIV